MTWIKKTNWKDLPRAELVTIRLKYKNEMKTTFVPNVHSMFGQLSIP